ncbi:TIR domain-containing protein [Flavobacterium sp.]|uniref:TIR domain-containing protein n=1 Tax=Flavobacterium sp. TaxID=239 RepID=UPI003A913C78
MYYHVLIETKADKQYFELDKINLDEIENDFIIPYLKEKKFQFDGYFLQPTEIIRLVIKSSEKTSKEYSKYENDNMPIGVISYVYPQHIISYNKYDKYTKDITKEIFSKVEKKLNTEQTSVKVTKSKKTNFTNVFIVHGHDDEAKIKVARFIEKLGFTPIILHEQASSGKTIIEKIEEYSDVGFGIVLYTPCDIGGKNETKPNLKNRARQNVIFEHGYLIGRIGRGNVCALVKGDVETPNDISGVVYIKMQTDEGWHLQLAKELRNSGYSVDMNKL